MWPLARQNRPGARVEEGTSLAFRGFHIWPAELWFRVTPCTGNIHRDRGTKWCTSTDTSGSGISLPVRAKRHRIGSLSARSSDIREGTEFHRRAFPVDRTCAPRAFRGGRWRLRWEHPRFATTAARLQAHRGVEPWEACFGENGRENAGCRECSRGPMLGRGRERVKGDGLGWRGHAANESGAWLVLPGNSGFPHSWVLHDDFRDRIAEV
jgi:hypothetical protein